VGVMSRSADSSVKRLEELLEGAEKTLAALPSLDRSEAERVGERMDRLASQLLAVIEPRSMSDVHEELGTEPLDEEESRVLTDEMSPPDGEG
jgi:hypothetical protein